jgi:hypothetical protein
MRKVFQTLVALRGLFSSRTGGCLRANSAPFIDILIAQERFFMAEAKINAPSPVRFPLPGLGYSLLVAVLLAGGLHALFISGPAMRAAAHEQVERAIADEDRSFCEMFGMHSGTTEFAACGRQLAIIRQKQFDRDNAAAQGIL